MSSYNELIALINGCINRNGVQAITGRVLNGVLRAMVNQLGAGYAMGGVAHPADDPGTPDAPVCYYASEVGTYTHFGNIQIVPGELALLCFDLTDGWFKETMYEGFESVQATIDGNVGTPAVNVTYVNGVLSFDFSNMKGNTGAAAGFGNVTAAVDGTIGTPGVSVQTDGPDTAKNIAFQFTGLKGETGVTSVIATVDNTSGTPQCAVSLNGQQLTLAFTGLKGAQGDTGSSVAYPFTIVNNLTTNDATQALSAAMGVQLEAEVSQLEAKLDGNYTPGAYLNSSGNPVSDSAWGYSDFIPYTPGNDIIWCWSNTNSNNASVCIIFYKSDKTMRDYYTASNASAQDGGRKLTSSQVGAATAYIKCSFKLGETAFLKINGVTAWSPNLGIERSLENAEQRIESLEISEGQMVKNVPQELTPVQKENVRDNISINDVLNGVPQNYISDVKINQGGISAETDMCVTDFIPCTEGDEIVWNFGIVGTGAVTLSLYDANKDYSNYFSSNGYTNTRTMTLGSGVAYKYLRASFKKTFTDGTPNLYPVVINGVKYPYKDNVPSFFDYVKENLEDEKRWKPLAIGKLINSDTNADGDLQHSDYYTPRRVTTASVVTPPFHGARIRFRWNKDVPYTLSVFFYTGNSFGSKSYDSVIDRMMDGDIRTIADSVRCLRPVFRASNTATGYSVEISATTLQGWIDDGTLALEYYDNSADSVVERNVGIIANLAALRRVLIPSSMADNGMNSMAVFGHITDLHGDSLRFRNFMDFCDKVKVDFAINSGDSILYQKRDATKYVPDIAKDHDTPLLFAIGNHESFPTGSATLFADNIDELATEYNYLSASGIVTDKCYYYMDFPEKSLRVIVLNQYEDGVYQYRFGQTQITWFINTLLSTPTGYGIVISYHAPEDRVVAEPPYDVFRQPEPNGSSSHPNGYYVDKRVIELIVDAFIEKGTASFTYEDHSATYNGTDDLTTESVSVSADFTGVDESTEFICYVAGHKHEDWIGFYYNSTHRQLYLGITCGNALYGDSSNPAWSNQSDLPRGGVGVSQDAFCVYAIDRLNGNVKVMRVGATVTQMMVKREMMVIPYKD